ncbi:MAG: hypothetical protein ACJAXA_002779 [Candidatus Aldehydirespiratoraceae bacterium]|jgi:hypothetical protein
MHRSRPRFELAVVALDPVVPILGGVVEHFWKQVIDNAQQRSSQIRGDLTWSVAARQHRLEEPCRSWNIASFRDEHIEDVAVLVDGSVWVAPHTGGADVGFIDESAVADTVLTRVCGVDDQWCGLFHPSVDGDVIDFDAAFGGQFFDVAV